jgi:alpha-galactosidase
LAYDIHTLGLKIGIYRQIVFAILIWHSNREYSDAGTMTCAGYPGSLGYEATDAATWESWDIDCELHDYCNPRVMFFQSLRHTDQT